MRAMASQRAVSALAGVAVLLALATPTSSAVPALPIPPNMDGPNNGGHFIFGTVSWTKLQHDPPMIEFTVEAAFRRSYSSTNFQGSGDDGRLVVGDTFKPSGLETIMFDFGDGSMLTPMLFTVQAWSSSEDWVSGFSTFRHTYAALTSSTPYTYVSTFKGCCRLSELNANADTAWSLSSLMNVRDDTSSPRLTIMPIQTVLKKARPSDPNPSFYVPAGDDKQHMMPLPATKAFSGMPSIGHAPSIIGGGAAPKNLAHMTVDAVTGKISLATGSVFVSDDPTSSAKCVVGGTGADYQASCMADYDSAATPVTQNVTGLSTGFYNIVIQLLQGNSSAPVDFVVLLVAEDPFASPPKVFPRLSSPTPHIFYPHFSYSKHVAYLGFPMPTLHLSGTVAAAGLNLGFTTGKLPANLRMSTISGGTAAYGYTCVNGTMFCEEAPATTSNGTDIPGCTAVEADTGKPCAGPHNSACRGGGVCQACWHLGTCPTSTANMTVDWTPTTGQEGTHMLCFDVTALRPEHLCPDPAAFGCKDFPVSTHVHGALSSPSQCVQVEVFKDPPPTISSTYEQDLDPWAHTHYAYLGRTLEFTIRVADENCLDTPAITMGAHMPPGASLGPQVETPGLFPVTVTSYLGVNDTSSRLCRIQSRVFSWHIPHTYGGYKGRHCFVATDECGDLECSGELDYSELCLNFQVAKCKYAVSLEQSIAEVASIFGTDWIQVFNLNDLSTPDHILFKNQVLNVGHKYVVGIGDTVLRIARRFGTTEASIKFLNYELGELQTTNISLGQELCIIPNSCFGEVQSIWDKNPHVDASLENWYSGVKSAYDALRKAKMEQQEARGPVAWDPISRRRLLEAEGATPKYDLLTASAGEEATAEPGDVVGAPSDDPWAKMDALMREVSLS